MDVYFDIKDEQLPIIYSTHYDIHFMGMEKLHPFDSAKWEKIFRMLESNYFFFYIIYTTVIPDYETNKKNISCILEGISGWFKYGMKNILCV